MKKILYLIITLCIIGCGGERNIHGIEVTESMPGYELLEEAGRKRGFLMARGEINTERMAKVLLDEYRSGKLGHFTLEMPEVTNE